jgi:hypothetical protein
MHIPYNLVQTVINNPSFALIVEKVLKWHYIVLHFVEHSDIYIIKVVDRRMRKIKTVHLRLILRM